MITAQVNKMDVKSCIPFKNITFSSLTLDRFINTMHVMVDEKFRVQLNFLKKILDTETLPATVRLRLTRDYPLEELINLFQKHTGHKLAMRELDDNLKYDIIVVTFSILKELV
jgi:hypothetical protein